MAETVSDPNEFRLHSVDTAMLTPLVRRLLKRPALAVIRFDFSQVHGGLGGGLGGTAIYRFNGDALDHGETVPWSLILKIVRARPADTPESTHYWKREFEAYRSGLLDNLPGNLVAAKSFGWVEYADEACWIWQEAVEDAIGARWEIEHHRLVARHLGTYNGAYLTKGKLPSQPWLSTGWLRKIVQAAEEHVEPILEMLRTLVIRKQLQPDAEEQFLRVWGERVRLLDALDRLPQTFCHQDAVRANLFIRRGEDDELETVAIDWAFAGIGPVGMEIAVGLIINLLFMVVDAANAAEMSAELYSGYLEGLREAGFKGDARMVRLGFVVSSVCKFFESLMLDAIFGFADPARAPEWEAMGGHPIEEIFAAYSVIYQFVLVLADEARLLMDELGYQG